MNELSSRHLSLSQQRLVHAGLATTHVSMTSDAITRLDLTPNFGVTYLPRKIEQLIEVVTPEIAGAQLAPFLARATLD